MSPYGSKLSICLQLDHLDDTAITCNMEGVKETLIGTIHSTTETLNFAGTETFW